MQETGRGCHHTEIGTQRGLLHSKCSAHPNRQNTAMLCNQNQQPAGTTRSQQLDITIVHQEMSASTPHLLNYMVHAKVSLTSAGGLGLSLPTWGWGCQIRSTGSFGRRSQRCWETAVVRAALTDIHIYVFLQLKICVSMAIYMHAISELRTNSHIIHKHMHVS